MSRADSIPDDVRRFILTSVDSVPYLEAVLLLRRESGTLWTQAELAKRIYLPESRTGTLLRNLQDAGIAALVDPAQARYGYRPAPGLAEMLDRVAQHYSTNLVGVTDLIHSSLDRRAHQFADAFRWRKD